jgi:outer membrane protein assembly factor BamB
MINRQAVAIIAVGITTAISLSLSSAGFAADWPCFRGPNHNGTLAEKLTLIGGDPVVVWKAQVGKGNCSVSIAGGRLFTAATGKDDTIICLDANSGRKIWSVSVLNYVAHSTPSVADGRVYALLHSSDKPLAVCLSADDGKQLWSANLPASKGQLHYGPAGSPLVWKDLVFFNVAGGSAINRNTGQVIWSNEGHTAYSTPVIFTHNGKDAVAFFTGDKLIARDAFSGSELWSIPWATSLHVSASDPLFIGNFVLLTSAYGRGRALYDIGGPAPKLLWEDNTNGSGHSFLSGFVRGQEVFFCTDSCLATLDLASGKVLWRGPRAGSALLIGETLICLTSQGELVAGALDTSRQFEPSIRATVLPPVTYNTPAYCAGRLYVKNDKGDIACLKIGQ